jgi:hypothetical protein
MNMIMLIKPRDIVVILFIKMLDKIASLDLGDLGVLIKSGYLQVLIVYVYKVMRFDKID